MTDPAKPREAEPMAVTLVRIETGVASVLEKVSDLRTEVTQHRGKIGTLELEMQQVKSDQRSAEKDLKAADKAREDTAAALEKQNALALAKAKDAVDSATRAWAPRNFAIALGSLFVAAIAVYIAFKYGGSVAPEPPVR